MEKLVDLKMTKAKWELTEINEKIGIVKWVWLPSFPINNGLNLEIGQRVYLLEKYPDWYYAMIFQGSSPFYFTIPMNYVKLIAPGIEPSKKCKNIYYEKNMISQLIYTVLNGWINAMKYSLNYFSIERLIVLVGKLLEIRKNLLDPLYKINEASVVEQINEGNTFFGMEYIPFANDLFVDPSNTTLYNIYEIHSEGVTESSTQATSGASVSDLNELNKQQLVDDYYHLYISFESVLWELGDPSMWCIGVYDSTNDSYITEKLIIHYKSASTAKENQPMTGCALFEVAKSSILHGLILFIKVYRFGSLFSDKKNESDSSYKRPYAIAAYPLNGLLKGSPNIEVKERLPLLLPEEYEFGNSEMEFAKDSLSVAKMSITFGYNVSLSLKYFNSSLQKIKLDHPEIFREEMYKIPFAGLPDVMTPDEIETEYYLTLRGASFDKFSPKGKPLNVEATVTVWTLQGKLLSNCIKIGHGKDVSFQTEYKSAVLHHSSHPYWNETISFKFTSTQIDNIRVMITFSHISSSPGKSKAEKMTTIGFTVIKFQNADRTIILNAEADYHVKKIETHSVTKGMQAAVTDDPRKLTRYFEKSYTGTEAAPNEENGFSYSDVVRIRTLIFTTLYTSNPDVNFIKEMNDDKEYGNLREVFSRFQYVDSIEVVKFIEPIFRNIVKNMAPLDEKGENLYFFQAFAKLISVVDEKRFIQYNVVLDRAINNTIMPLCWKRIIQSVDFCIKNIEIPTSRIYYEVVKTFIDNLAYIFKVIIKSYEDFCKSPFCEVSDKNANQDITHTIVTLFENLLKVFYVEQISSNLYPLEIKLLNNFIVVIEKTGDLFSFPDLANLISLLLASTQNSNAPIIGLKNNIILYKLKLMRKISNCDKFKNYKFRTLISPIIFKSLHTIVTDNQNNMEICIESSNVLIIPLQYVIKIKKNDIYLKELINELITIFFDANHDLVSKALVNKKNESLSVLLSLLSVVSTEVFNEYFLSLPDNTRIQNLTKWLRVFDSIFIEKYYPKPHVVLWVSVCTVILKITNCVFNTLKENFSCFEKDALKIELVHAFLDFALSFINCSCFDSHNLVNIFLIEYLHAGIDMRVQMAQLVFQLWSQLVHEQVAHLYNYAQKIVIISLIDLPDLRVIMFRILYDFLIFDYNCTKCMDSVARTIISYIDSDTYSNDRYRLFSQDFKRIMNGLWNSSSDQNIKTLGISVTNQIVGIIDTLAYYSVPDKFDNCAFLHAFRSHQMIEFHTRISHDEMIHTNIFRLLRFNELMDAHTEAALCYLQLEKNYSWDFTTQLPVIVYFETSTPGSRKETCIQKSIELFERGLNLEMAVESCKSLVPLYEKHQINFIKLSKLYQKISVLLERIARGESSMDCYFRFNFIGMDFPEQIRNKSFMSHVGSCSSLVSTVNFLKKQFPNAIIPPMSSYDEKLREQNVQYIFVTTFQPIPTDKALFEKYYQASEPVSRFFKNANVVQFEGIASVENKREKTDEGPPSCTFVKTSCKVSYSLPTIINVAPIIEEHKTIITEFEQSLDLLKNNSRELNDQCRAVELNSSFIKNVQMKTSGCLNAFVNGGLSMIIPKYYTGSFLLENPTYADKLELMTVALNQFMTSNADALKLLVVYLSDSMAGFIINLIESYQAMKELLEKNANVKCEDLTYLLSMNSGAGMASPGSSGYSSSKPGSMSNPPSRKDTVTSAEYQKSKDYNSTLKSRKGTLAVNRATHPTEEEEEKARAGSVQSNEKLPTSEMREKNYSYGTLGPVKSKKRYGLFQKKK